MQTKPGSQPSYKIHLQNIHLLYLTILDIGRDGEVSNIQNQNLTSILNAKNAKYEKKQTQTYGEELQFDNAVYKNLREINVF